jgi:RNA polymerase sigma factor (sigma-70 family)
VGRRDRSAHCDSCNADHRAVVYDGDGPTEQVRRHTLDGPSGGAAPASSTVGTRGGSAYNTYAAETPRPLDFPDSGPNPEDSCSRREQERILSAALSELTPGTRKAIELRELGELSTRETAQVMGLSAGAVKARVFHGRKKLRLTLERYVEPTQAYGSRALRTRRVVRDRSGAILELRPAC